VALRLPQACDLQRCICCKYGSQSRVIGSASAADEHASCKGIVVTVLAEGTRFIHEIVEGLELPLGVGVYVSAAAGRLHEEDVLACLDALGSSSTGPYHGNGTYVTGAAGRASSRPVSVWRARGSGEPRAL
jgi:hypothetical protein